MKLLLDQNLSPVLVSRLDGFFPGSRHVSSVGLDRASDRKVWDYARNHGFHLVTKDSDFGDMSVLYGSPPKVIWLRMGNCTTSKVEEQLKARKREIEEFDSNPSVSLLIIR